MRNLGTRIHATAYVPPDPFDERPVRRQADARRHCRRVVAAVTVSLVLAAATGIGLRVAAKGHESVKVITRPQVGPAVRGPDERGLSQWTVPGATAVTLSGDDLWVVGQAASRGGRWYLARIDRSTGKERARIAVPHVVQRVAVGLGMVWGFGGGDAAEPNGGVTVVDPDREAVVASYGYDHPFSPSGLTFVDKSAVVSDTTTDRVLLFDLRPGNLSVAASYPVGHQPTDLVAPPGESPWVRESGAGTISRVPITDPARTAPWAGRLLAPAGPSQIWATDGDAGRLVLLNPDLLAQGSSVALGTRIAGVPATAATVDPEGIWVGGPGGVSRFVRRALESAGDPKPAAVLAGYRVSSLAGNTQGVWFVAQQRDAVYRWVPKDLAEPEPSVDANRRRQGDGADTFVAVEASRIAVFDAYTGRRLRFLTDGQAGGGDSSPALADDGTLFFVRGNGTCSSGIWRLPPGAREVRVVQPPDGAVSQVAVSPDGRMLAWVEQPCRDVAVLRTKNLGTGADTSFKMDAPPSVEGRLAWSPDNRHLAYFYGRTGGGVGGVRIVDTTSAATRADEGMPLQGPDCPQWSPAFLPEGTLVVLTCHAPTKLDRVDAVRFDPADGRMLGALFSLAKPAGPGPELFLVRSFDFSTRGRHAIYQIEGQGEAAHSRTFRWDGASPTPISTDAQEPAW
jgi:hypothetical protein